jgi:hypothetical protein
MHLLPNPRGEGPCGFRHVASLEGTFYLVMHLTPPDRGRKPLEGILVALADLLRDSPKKKCPAAQRDTVEERHR